MMKLRSNSKRTQNKALSVAAKTMSELARERPNRNLRQVLAMLATTSKGLRENIGNTRNILEARIRQGDWTALQNMRRIVNNNAFIRYKRIWANAQRNQKRNQFIANFGTINSVRRDPHHARIRIIQTNRGTWRLYDNDGGHSAGTLHKWVNYGGWHGYRPYGIHMGPVHLRNNRIVLANRPANWQLPNPNPLDLFQII